MSEKHSKIVQNELLYTGTINVRTLLLAKVWVVTVTIYGNMVTMCLCGYYSTCISIKLKFAPLNVYWMLMLLALLIFI